MLLLCQPNLRCSRSPAACAFCGHFIVATATKGQTAGMLILKARQELGIARSVLSSHLETQKPGLLVIVQKKGHDIQCPRDFNWISASMDSEAMWPGSSDERQKRLCMRHLLPDDAQLHCTQIRLSVDQAGNVHVWAPEVFNPGIQNLHPMKPVRRWDLASLCFKQAKSIR